jgi:hypothetical protein
MNTRAVSLSAEYVENDNSVRLAWQLPSEEKTGGFFIQRSIDRSSFKNFGFMPVNNSGNYNFTDVYPLLQGYYKVVWFQDQGFESNDVFAVATEADELQLIPNPAGVKVRILLRDLNAYDATVGIYNNTGTQVSTYQLGKGNNSEIDISGLKSGLYYLRAQMNHKVYHKRLLKQ